MVSVGTTLGGNIRLEEELGRGAMGVVWRAKHLSLGSDVAVKVLQRAPGHGSNAEVRFEREARGAAMLDTPHVVKVMDLGATVEGSPYIVMELLRGRDLRSHIERRGHLSLRETAHILDQLCRALAVAHLHHIVHRDIKPANIFLLDPDGQPFVKVLDFGVAKYAAQDMSLTNTGALMGTPYYMSPEQFIDPRNIDHRSDLWSVAVVAYGCLLGALPFLGQTVGALSLAVHSGQFRLPSGLRPELPKALDLFFERAFKRLPDDRFHSAAELSAAFHAAIEGHVVSGPAGLPSSSNASLSGASAQSPPSGSLQPVSTAANSHAMLSTQAPVTPAPAAMPFQAPQTVASATPEQHVAHPVPSLATPGPAVHAPTPSTFAQDPPEPAPKKGRGVLVAVGVLAALGLGAVSATVVLPMLQADATATVEDDEQPERDEVPSGKKSGKKRKKADKAEPKSAAAPAPDDSGDFPDINPTEPPPTSPAGPSPAPARPDAPATPDGPEPPSPSPQPSAKPGRKTIPDVTGIAQHMYSCWSRFDGPEAKKVVSMTATMVMPDTGTSPQGIQLAGAGPYSAFRGCVLPKLSAHARLNYTDRERGNNVVMSVTLPKCRWDKAQRKHICK